MKRHEYIKKQAIELNSLCSKREKLKQRYNSDLSPKMAQNISAELNFLGMSIDQTEERLSFALGRLLPENARQEYRPSPFHTYKGIRFELEKTVFD